MTGIEQAYALYVQANPVPDPAELSLTHDAFAALPDLAVERSSVMLTEDQRRVEAPRTEPSWLRPVLAAAAAFVVVIAAGLAFWWASGGDTVPAADAKPMVTFDGSAAVYDGPATIETGAVEFTITNTSSEAIAATVWAFDTQEALDAELALQPLGSDFPMDLQAGISGPAEGAMWANITADPEGSSTGAFILPPGHYLVDVVTLEAGAPVHAWRAAETFEVVEVGS